MHKPRSPLMTGEAVLRYSGGDFSVIQPGAFVSCALTGKPIRMEDLRYWCVERQEAYAGPDIALQAEQQAGKTV